MSLATLAPVLALPWLQGFFAPVAVSDRGSRECVTAKSSPMALTADVAVSAGAETIVASYASGVDVIGHDGKLLAHAAGSLCGVHAGELIALAIGDGAIGVPLIALASTSVALDERTTSLTLYSVAPTGALQPAFVGEVERHAEHTTRTGVVTLIPGGLVYRDVDGVISLWSYDATLRRYTEELTTRPSA